MVFRVRASGDHELFEVARRLEGAGRELRGAVATELKAAITPVRDRVKNEIIRADMPGDPRPAGAHRFRPKQRRSQGVRRPTAAAVRSVVRTYRDPEAAVEMLASRVPARIRQLVPYWTGQRRRLRHPVMGNREVWVGQRIPNVWRFTGSDRRHMRAAVGRALTTTRKRIER